MIRVATKSVAPKGKETTRHNQMRAEAAVERELAFIANPQFPSLRLSPKSVVKQLDELGISEAAHTSSKLYANVGSF